MDLEYPYSNKDVMTRNTPFCKEISPPPRELPENNVMYRCDNLECYGERNYLPSSLYWVSSRRGWYCGWCIRKIYTGFPSDFQRLDDYLELGVTGKAPIRWKWI